MIVDGSWCEPQKLTEYSSLDEAKDACNRDSDCTMFYNLESKNQSYIICGPVYTIRPSNGAPSTLYKKCKNRKINLIYGCLIHINILNLKLNSRRALA